MLDNYGTHKHPVVLAWLEKKPRITLHFTPMSNSWMNMVEIFFGIITKQGHPPRHLHQRQGTRRRHRRLHRRLERRCEPFVWTKSADEILAKYSTHSRSSGVHWLYDGFQVDTKLVQRIAAHLDGQATPTPGTTSTHRDRDRAAAVILASSATPTQLLAAHQAATASRGGANSAIRAWARRQGLPVGTRGRLSAETLDAYAQHRAEKPRGSAPAT